MMSNSKKYQDCHRIVAALCFTILYMITLDSTVFSGKIETASLVSPKITNLYDVNFYFLRLPPVLLAHLPEGPFFFPWKPLIAS